MRILTLIWACTMPLWAQSQPDPNFTIPLPDSVTAYPGRNYQPVSTDFFYPGEEISLRLNFGWFTVGRATMKTDRRYHRINGRDTYRVDIKGWTTGMVDWIAKVDDVWTAYLDRHSLVTHIATRNIKEGNYRKNEITKFDHDSDMIEVTVLDRKTGSYGKPKYYRGGNDMRDMIGGYFFLRTIDYSGMRKGDVIKVTGFFEDTFYDMKIVYLGKETIDTKMGDIRTIKLRPIMPKNDLFDGEDSITAWLSDDKNRLPVKVKAEMFIGSAGFEITGVRNLRHKLNID